jgi:predicted Zn-dependent protease
MTGGQILIAFADADEVPQMETADGIARSHPVQRPGATIYASGQVTLQSTDFGRILDRAGGYAEARAIVMHELGHVLGLDHVNDPNEIMYAKHVRVDELGPGDRTGLKILGAGPCY